MNSKNTFSEKQSEVSRIKLADFIPERTAVLVVDLSLIHI